MTYRLFMPLVAKAGAIAPEPEPLPWSKRGVAGFTWSQVVERYRWSGSRITWGHSWGLHTGTGQGVERVPMVWGMTRPAHPHYGLAYALENLPRDYDGWLLVLNEPADENQSNISPLGGADLWLAVCEGWPLAKLVGPQMLAGMDGTGFYARAQGWFQQFWAALPAWGRARVAAHSYHIYHSLANEHTQVARQWMDWCDAVAGARPYWVTEWGVNGSWHPVDGGKRAVREIAAWYDAEQRVARHAYFIPWIDAGDGWGAYRMFGDNGMPTGIGRGWGLKLG